MMQGFDLAGILSTIGIVLVPLVFAITVHEVAHGWVAKRFGDPTASDAGRLTLNPIKHIDPIGTLILPLVLYIGSMGQFVFGWAKPVPVIFGNLGNPRRDMILVAAAGPGSNILMATGWALLIYALINYLPIGGAVGQWLFEMSVFGIRINVILAFINMVPIPPLDGGRVLHGLLPPREARILDRIEPYGMLIVIGLVIGLAYLGLLGPLIEPPLGAMYRFFFTIAGMA